MNSVIPESYNPGPIPANSGPMGLYVQNEFFKVAAYMEALRLGGALPKTHVAPTKTHDGMLRYADGTNWNPGSGEGIYAYYGSAWNKL